MRVADDRLYTLVERPRARRPPARAALHAGRRGLRIHVRLGSRPWYVRGPTATSGCSTGAAAAAACSCRRSRSASGTTSATTGRYELGRAIARRAFDLGILHFDLANNYGPPFGSAEENFGRILRDDLRALPRRADHLDQGRLRHVARPVRRVGLAQVPAREPRPVAGADGPRLRRPLLLAPLRSGDAARGDDRRARHRRAAGEGALRRHLVLLGREDARGRGDRTRPRHADRDPPAVVLDAQPLDRAGAARRARGRGHRLHRLLAARAGDAHRPLSRRHPGGLAGRPRGHGARRRAAERGDAREGARPERDRGGPRAVTRADGDRLDPPRPA